MDLTGRTLGKYKLIERIGQGGMAQVYKAIQPTIERPVAVKVLHSHLSDSEDFVARFKREARGLGLLQHPHIVHVIDFDVADGVYFMVVDYVPGKTLRAYLDERGVLDYAEALRIAAQLADALAYAHRRGTIHRDIKPANVLFKDETDQHVVLTDFGIGRLLTDATMTMSGSVIGTPAYMSPEAVMGQRVDARADIYSLGIILYEMVTGHVPYTGNTPMSVIMKQVNEPLPSLRKVKPDMPEALVQLIEKALEKDPAKRFQTADEFLAAIRAVEAALHGDDQTTAFYRTIVVPDQAPAGFPDATPPPDASGSREQVSQLPEPAGATTNRGRLPLFVALGVLVLALVGAGVWYGLNQSGARQVAGVPTATNAPEPTAAPTEPTPTEEPAAPTGTSEPEPTAEPSPEATIAPTTAALPLTVPGRTGELRFADNETVRAGDFVLSMDRVLLPPAGSHYELWLQNQDGSARNLGALTVEDNRILFNGSTGDNLVAGVSAVLISVEPDGANTAQATAPGGQVVYAGRLDETYAAEMRQVLVEGNEIGFLVGAQEQAAVALQHGQFAQDALAQGDLAEAQRHAEHVVNILDGENGAVFGDVNLDGQAQNPGDGFGVRAYVEASRRHVEQAYGSVEPTADRQYHVDGVLSASTNALARIDTAIGSALSLAATDTTDEAQPFAETLIAELNALAADAAEQNTLVSAYQHALALISIPLVAEQEGVPAPDALSDTVPGRVGIMRLSNNETARGGDFLLQMAQVPPPPAGAHYDVWLLNESNDDTLFLGELDVTAGIATLAVSQAENLLANYNRLIVSVEDTLPNLFPSDIVAFEGELVVGIGPDVLRLFAEETDNGKGALFGAEDQLRTALQHRQFAQEALATGDLAEAQRHSEHVINILDGADGKHFGDLNFDGQAQNPGDGIGVRGYLLALITEMERLQETGSLTGNQQFYAGQVIATSTAGLDATEAAIQQALKVLASDTPDEARPFLDATAGLLGEVLNGSDVDGNGVIDPLTAEGGLVGASDAALALNEINIFATTADQATLVE